MNIIWNLISAKKYAKIEQMISYSLFYVMFFYLGSSKNQYVIYSRIQL